jgi:hypothetical protein
MGTSYNAHGGGGGLEIEHKILIGKSEERRPLGGARRKW